jgi:hypothetical protein
VRVLHEDSPDEVIIAQGQYRYMAAGEPTGQIETWKISRLPDGTQIVRADIDGRQSPLRANLVSHLTRDTEGRPQWLRLRYDHGETMAAAHYSFQFSGVRVFRQVGGFTRREETLDVAENYELDYHPVIAHDFVWRGYPEHAKGDTWAIPLFSPEMWPPDEDETLSGRSLRFRVKPLELEAVDTPIGVFEKARSYEVETNDGVRSLAWFDDYGIPIRWLYPEKRYDFVLINYKREQI